MAALGAISTIRPLLHALIATPACAVCLAFAFLGLARAIGLLHPAPLGVPTLHLPPLHVPTLNLTPLRVLFCALCAPGAIRAILAIPLRTFTHYGPALAAAVSFGSGPLLLLNTGLRPLAPFDVGATSLPYGACRLSLRRRALAAVSFLAIRRALGQGQLHGAKHRCGGGG